MGNALRCLFAPCGKSSADESIPSYGGSTGLRALSKDLSGFKISSKVPEDLSKHVVSSNKAQANWYKKLQVAWSDRPPRTPEEATRLIITTLRRHQKADIEGFLAYYGLPGEALALPPAPVVKFELKTLPVNKKAVADGDTITVYVNVASSKKEADDVPTGVKKAFEQRTKARGRKDYPRADELQNRIVEAGYRAVVDRNKEILARKYRIRLSGIDAPESAMAYGKEAKMVLTALLEGKPLKILVYGEDRYARCVGDVYCNGKLAQEVMLKKGLAWHYKAYDQRPNFALWESQAKAGRIGLWASKDPQEPWEWRKMHRQGK